MRVQSQSVARSPQGVGEPAACASLFDAGTSQSGRAARLPRDRRGGPFPQRGQREERSGASPEPGSAAATEEAAAGGSGGGGGTGSGPTQRASPAPCAAESSEERGSRDTGVDKARWQGS